MSGSRTRHRRFNYKPKYYDPSVDERKKRSIRFTSNTRRGQGKSVIMLAAFLFAVFYALLNMDVIVTNVSAFVEYLNNR